MVSSSLDHQLSLICTKSNLFHKSHHLILWLLFCITPYFAQSQENLVSNGDLSQNRLWITEDEKKRVPMLEYCSNVKIDDFKGMFCYPYPDSFAYLGFKIGNGYSISRNPNLFNKSEVCGTFKRSLKKNTVYMFQFEYFPYWGNCMVVDSIPFYLIDINGRTVQSLKVYFGNDSPYQSRTIEFNFTSNGTERYFCLRKDSTDKIKLLKCAEFIDSFLSKRNRRNEFNESRCHNYIAPWTADSVTAEKRMRIENPFIYYLLNNFSCTMLTDDSSKICDVVIDTSLVSVIYFRPNSDSSSIEKLLLHKVDLYEKRVLLKSYSDRVSDTSDLSIISALRAENTRELLEAEYNCYTQMELLEGNIPISNDPKGILNRRVEIYTLRNRYVNCLMIKP